MLNVNISNVAIKNVNYCWIIHSWSKPEVINLFKKFYFEDFLFSIYEMVDSDISNIGIYKSVKISIGGAMQNPEMMKFVPGHLKTRTI